MNNTQSRIALGHQDVAVRDSAGAREHDGEIAEAEVRELEPYGFESDKQTMVGLGPVERVHVDPAEIPESQRMPQSVPGPFIADDETQPSLRKQRSAPWTIVPLALMMAAAGALVMLRAVAPRAPAASKLVLAAASPASLAPTPETLVPSPPLDDPRLPPPVDVRSLAMLAPARAAVAPAVASPASAPTAAAARGPVAAPALSVKLSELAGPSVVNLASNAETSAGTINVSSSPPANLVLDGRPLGPAPRVVKVPAGVHTLVFIHSLYGRKSRSVTVSPGATSNVSADF